MKAKSTFSDKQGLGIDCYQTCLVTNTKQIPIGWMQTLSDNTQNQKKKWRAAEIVSIWIDT